MTKEKLTRRKFLDYAKLSVALLLSSCQGISTRISIGLHKKFLPQSFKDTFPKNWKQQNINYNDGNLNVYLNNQDLFIINDGWLNKVKLKEYIDISPLLSEKIDTRSNLYLRNWDMFERKKLFPVGFIPYALLIKNNYKYKITDKSNWDFLLSKELNGKLILPNSPRILVSIANKITHENPLKALINQNNIYDDQNAIDWLINSDAAIALMPFTNCIKYLKFDTRLSVVFPNQGVPLMWNFLLIKNNLDQQKVLDWLDTLLNKRNIKNLIREGWYLPFVDKNIETELRLINNENSYFGGPSEECLDNSWSFKTLDESEKIGLQKLWKNSLAP